MPKVTKTLGNNKARAWESLGFAHKNEQTTAKARSKLVRQFMDYAWNRKYKALNISVVTLQGESQADHQEKKRVTSK